MERLGFIYNIDKCIGCKACQVACKDKNDLEIGTFYRKVDTIKSEGEYIHYSGGCNHCKEPACVKVCPTNAMHILTDKTVGHTLGKCIGCGLCIWSCPYKAISFSKQMGIATKCNSCIDLREKGEKPACVKSCLTHCLDFDVIEGKDLDNHPTFLPSNKQTQPSLVINTKERKDGRVDE